MFFWDLPSRAWAERLRNAGVKIWAQVGSVERALEAIRLGAVAIIAQGSEAGGHNHSSCGLFSLVPSMVDAIAPVPVIAAGGIADGRGVAAALALGADGVCVGTRLLASNEAFAHAEYKRRIVQAGTTDIARSAIFGPEWPDRPMRVIRNRVVREWAGRDERTPSVESLEPIGHTLLGGQKYPMPRFSAILPTPDTSGDFEEMCLAAGEGAGLIRDIKPAAHIVRGMISEAEQIISRRLEQFLSVRVL